MSGFKVLNLLLVYDCQNIGICMDLSYEWAFEGEGIDVQVEIDWTKPLTHDMLNYGLSSADESANFYAIIGMFDGYWWPYYIGKVYFQAVSSRHKNSDHVKRLDDLKASFPKVVWHLTLGTPKFLSSRKSEALIDTIEGLLIYGCWHEEMANKSKVNNFNAHRQIHIKNTGFRHPFPKNIGYGVFLNEE